MADAWTILPTTEIEILSDPQYRALTADHPTRRVVKEPMVPRS